MERLSSNPAEPERSLRAQPFFSSPARAFFAAALLGAALLSVVGGMGLGLAGSARPATLIGVSTYLGFAVWALFRLSQSYPHGALGLCNLVTLARLAIAGFFVMAIFSTTPPSWATFGLAALSLMLDGIDGWLARRQRLSSEFGAWFDVEVDAFFALLLAVFAATSGMAAAYVVLLGLPYYLFKTARTLLPWLGRPLPDRFSRKAICVFQIGALIALQAPLFARGQLDPLIALVALALCWSFGRDILWLRRVAND